MFSFIDFGIWDFIDIILTTFLIYLVLTRVKNPYLLRFFIAIGIFLIISEIVNSIGLEVLSFILDMVREIAFIGIIVIFSQEFRSAVLSLLPSPSTVLRGFDVEKFANELADALIELKERGLGAIVVLEKNIDILHSNIVDSERYFLLNQPFSKELLIKIFEEKDEKGARNKYHDGAVIIKNNEIIAAGVVVIELGYSTGNYSNIGTRHRAAIVLSRTMNTLVFVVSKDKKIISVAKNGLLYENYNKDQIIYEVKQFYKY